VLFKVVTTKTQLDINVDKLLLKRGSLGCGVGAARSSRTPSALMAYRRAKQPRKRIATMIGQFFGKASYALNVIGRDIDEDSCAVPEAGICFRPFLSQL
jgi:hypothetical protein